MQPGQLLEDVALDSEALVNEHLSESLTRLPTDFDGALDIFSRQGAGFDKKVSQPFVDPHPPVARSGGRTVRCDGNHSVTPLEPIANSASDVAESKGACEQDGLLPQSARCRMGAGEIVRRGLNISLATTRFDWCQ
jgi:hypothetical protein